MAMAAMMSIERFMELSANQSSTQKQYGNRRPATGEINGRRAGSDGANESRELVCA